MAKKGVRERRKWNCGKMGELHYIQMRKLKFKKKKRNKSKKEKTNLNQS